MRAIVKCTAATPVEADKLQKTLEQHDWWPRLPQDDPEVTERKNEILGHVAEDDRPLVEGTLVCTIYDEETKTWGIVNNTTTHVLTFRLKNPIADRLKAAAEKLVSDLSSVTVGKRIDGGAFRFQQQIVVLEPHSEHSAFTGQILPSKGFLLAVKERKRETCVGIFTVVLTLLLVALTAPPIARWFFTTPDKDWQEWITGNLNRFTTAASVTATIAWFEVLLYWFQVRRQSAIRWSLE
jgi:hypothetical protein